MVGRGDPEPVDRPVLVTGCRGTLGRAFVRTCRARGLACAPYARADLDVTDRARVDEVLARSNAWAVVNAAGWVRVDEAESCADDCLRANTTAAAVLASACRRRGARLLTFSSDLVFDGAKHAPYVESDPVSPLSVYGRSKAEAERVVLTELPSAMVVRTSAFFGPWDDYNFVTLALRALGAGERWLAADDVVVSPTYVVDLVDASLDLLARGERGLFHLANRGAVSWAQLARMAAEKAGLPAGLIDARPGTMIGLPAARPSYSVLGSERTTAMPSLEDALSRYVEDRRER